MGQVVYNKLFFRLYGNPQSIMSSKEDIFLRNSLGIKRTDSYHFVVDTTWNSIVCGGHIFMHDVLEIISILSAFH
jgi:hypothetical protein